MSQGSRHELDRLRTTDVVSKIAPYRGGGGMAIWWKRLGVRGDLIDHEATQFMKVHGDHVLEVVRKSARKARNKRDLRQARHFFRVALRIAEKQPAPEAAGRAVPTEGPLDQRSPLADG